MAEVAGLRDAMLAEIEKMVADGAAVSVLCRQIGCLEPVFSFSPEKMMSSASVIKVPIMMTALNQVCKGQLRLNQLVPVGQQDVLPDSQVFDGGPRSCTLEELLVWMIVLSDNTSTNVLIDLLGMDAVNQYCASIGLPRTRLRRKMLDFAARESGVDNTTSAADMDRLYRQLCSDMLLNETMSSKALSILWRQRDGRLFRRYIWEEVGIAHKTGGLDYLSHDSGVFFIEGKRVYLGVFVEDAPNIEGAPAFIGRLARLLYDHYVNKP